MIAAQGGNPEVCDHLALLPAAPVVMPVHATKDMGWLSETDGVALGLAAQRMGAGRMTKDDIIDPAAYFHSSD